MTTIKLLNAPQKFNRSAQALKWSIKAQIRMHNPDLIFVTEIGPGDPKRAKALATIEDYGFIHFRGLGFSECGILYKLRSKLHILDKQSNEINHTGYAVPGGERHNVVQIGAKFTVNGGKKKLIIMGSHWPNTEGDARFKGPEDRVEAWKKTCIGSARFWSNQVAEFFIDVADYNCRFDFSNEMRTYADAHFHKLGMHRQNRNEVHGVASSYVKGAKVMKTRMIRQANKNASDHPYVLTELEL